MADGGGAKSMRETMKIRRQEYRADMAEEGAHDDDRELDENVRAELREGREIESHRRLQTKRQKAIQSTRQAHGGVDAGGVGPNGSTSAPAGDSGGSSRVADLQQRVAELEGLIKANNAQMEMFFKFFGFFMDMKVDIKAQFDAMAKGGGHDDVIKIYQTGKGIIDAGSNSGRK